MGESKRVLCVSPDVAVDKTTFIPDFHVGKLYRPPEVLTLAGGKGCNCARVLKILGAEPVVTGWVGGNNGSFIEEGMGKEGIATRFVRIDAESRVCLVIVDPARGTVTEINEVNPEIKPHQVEQLYQTCLELLPGFDMVTLSGRLPLGVPLDFYVRLIEAAHACQKTVLLDTYGESLRHSIPARASLIKPNLNELCELIGQPLNGLDEIARAAVRLSQQYGSQVVVTLGAQGMVAAEQGSVFSAQVPPVQAVNATGSGDAFLAGLAYAQLDGGSFEEALRLGLAASAANTLQLGAGVLRREQVEELLKFTQVNRL